MERHCWHTLGMPSSFGWSDLFAVGHERLDREHRHLVELIARFCAAIHAREDLARLADHLGAIKQATRAHLRSENAVLRELKGKARDSNSGRPGAPRHLGAITDAAIEDHIAEHRLMIKGLTAIAERVDGMTHAEGPALCADIKAWFLDHAVKHDAHLTTIFQAL
jgi:hemerythrin